MTRDELRAAGEALYGARWQTALARELGVADRTVRRWLAGLPIGEWAVRAINRLVALRGGVPLGEPSLGHATLNTGNLVYSPRSGVHAETMEVLQSMIAAGYGDAAGIPFRIPERGAGTALITIGEPPAVLCGVCWDESRSDEAWMTMLEAMRQSGYVKAPDRIPPVPWLAVLMLPAMLALPIETILMLGDLERCLAWAVIEAEMHRGRGARQ